MSKVIPKKHHFLLISPYPADTTYGGGQRLLGIVDALIPFGEIDLVITETPGPYPLQSGIRETIFVDLRHGSFLKRCYLLFVKIVPFILPKSTKLREQVLLMSARTNYSLVICRYPRTLARLGKFPKLKVLLDVDDIEYERKFNDSKATSSFSAKLYLLARASLSWYLYRKVINVADFLWFVRDDYSKTRKPANVWRVPNVAFSVQSIPTSQFIESNKLSSTLIFIGHFGYPPNRQGIKWFLDKVWPIVLKNSPLARVDIVGKCNHGETLELIKSSPRARYIGYVSSLDDVYKNAAFCINPCNSGSGTHIKIIEAMLYGRLVISTRYGARGWESAIAECGSPVIAGNENDFAESCSRFCLDTGERSKIQMAAATYASANGTPDFFRSTVRRFLVSERIVGQ